MPVGFRAGYYLICAELVMATVLAGEAVIGRPCRWWLVQCHGTCPAHQQLTGDGWTQCSIPPAVAS